jgi:hypothetical protein
MMRIVFALFLMALFAAPALAAPKAVVFDFELIDTSLGGEMHGTRPEERVRLAKMAPELRDKLGASGRYEIVPLGAEEAEAKAVNLQSCGGCDVAMAKKLGADLSITGTVQKVSDILLNVNIYIRDVKTGEMTEAMTADVRNNTDDSWARGLSYLIRNRLLVAPEKPAPEKPAPEKNAQ